MAEVDTTALTEAELVAWLLERIAADEQTAQWVVEHTRPPIAGTYLADDGTETDSGYTPVRVLAECETKRALIEAITGRWHLVVSDCWYTCPAATEEREGETTCNDGERGKPCDCGRDKTVREQLELLAAPYRIGG